MAPRITTLNNGLRVVTEHMPTLKTSALGVWIGAGARNETAANNGVAHMLEHMAFKGTERRNARAIAEEIEAVGGHLNAYTSREQTAYFARTLAEDVPLSIDMLADILQHSTFEPAELERERGVIIQEIGQTNDTPDDLVFDNLQHIAWPDQPLGRSILGTEALVAGIKREDLSGFMASNYHAPGMVLAAAGAVDHDQIVAMAQQHFGGLSGSAPQPFSPGLYVGGESREERDLDQAHVALGFPGISFDDPDFYAVQVYATLLGGGMSSRLFQEVREKRGLCYSVFSFGSAYEDAGQVGVYAATSPEHSNELLDLTSEVMLSVASQVTEDEVARAKAQLKASLVMNLESASARADQIARQFLAFGQVPAIATLTAKIEAVTSEQVRALAERLFRHQKPAFSAVGHIGQLSAYDTITRHFA